MPRRRGRAARRGDGGAGKRSARAAHRSADRRLAGCGIRGDRGGRRAAAADPAELRQGAPRPGAPCGGTCAGDIRVAGANGPLHGPPTICQPSCLLLAEVVALRREEAAALADGGDLYDALARWLRARGDGRRDRGAVRSGCGRRIRLCRLARGPWPRLVPAPQLQGHFPKDQQIALAHDVAAAFGYDFARGRIDEAVHPFFVWVLQRCADHDARGRERAAWLHLLDDPRGGPRGL